MRLFGNLVYVVALAVLVGGGALYTFVLTPAIFAAYPRNDASGIVGTMMPHYFGALLLATVVALAALGFLWRGLPARFLAISLALLLVALAAQASVRWGLYPRILDAKARVASFEAAPDSPERVRFRKLHGVSMLLNLLTIVDGAALLALLPLQRR